MDLSASYILLALAVAGYLAGAAGHFMTFYGGRPVRTARTLTAVAWVFHAAALVTLVMEVRHPPFFNVAEALIFLTWVMVLNYLLIEGLFGLKSFGVFVVPLVFTLLVYAAALPRELDVSSAPAGSLGIILHALISLGSYGAFSLAFLVGVMYLLQEHQLRIKAFRLIYHRLPSLEALDVLSFRLVTLGFPLMLLGIISGGIWARLVWGVPWFLEPKGLWSLGILAIYGGYILLRVRYGWGGRRGAYTVIAGFVAILFNLIVVNNLLSRFHGF